VAAHALKTVRWSRSDGRRGPCSRRSSLASNAHGEDGAYRGGLSASVQVGTSRARRSSGGKILRSGGCRRVLARRIDDAMDGGLPAIVRQRAIMSPRLTTNGARTRRAGSHPGGALKSAGRVVDRKDGGASKSVWAGPVARQRRIVGSG
jgi:hypothetical protein